MKKVIRANAKSLSKNFYRVTPPSAKKEFQDALNGGDSPEPEPPVTSGYTFESITLPDEYAESQEIFFPEGYTAGQTIATEDIRAYLTAIKSAAGTLPEDDDCEMIVEVSGTIPVEEAYVSAYRNIVSFHLSSVIRS